MVGDIIGNFKLVYVKCSLEAHEKTDVKDMYEKAHKGNIKQFIGVSTTFEEHTTTDIIVDTENDSLEDCVKQILESMGF